jgi:hypothetical protein
MARRKAFWICDRRTAGVKCATRNPNIKQLCGTCGKRKPKRVPKKHMGALDNDYEHYIQINGGEHCGICGVTRAQTNDPSRKLDRDHVHTPSGLGIARGLLCRKCNMKFTYKMSHEWVHALDAYVTRVEQRLAQVTEDEEAA